MMDKKIVLCVVMLISCMGLQISDATICKPLSKFKLDCNTCFCSRDGARYACTRKACRGEPSEFQFINDEGFDEEIEPMNKDERIPYINDEIPPSKEEWEDEPNEVGNPDDYILPIRNDIDDRDPRFDKPIQDIDVDDQEVEDMNYDFRFKREIFV